MIMIIIITITFVGYTIVMLTVGTEVARITMILFGAWLGCVSVLAARYLES